MSNQYLNSKQKEFLSNTVLGSSHANAMNIYKKSKKNIQEFFFNTSFKKEDWPYDKIELDNLVKDGILYYVEKDGIFLITYKGILILEYNLTKDGRNEQLLDDLNSVIFEKNVQSKEEPLTLRHKVILLTILGLYAYSPVYSVDVNESNKQDFMEAANRSVILLKELYPAQSNELDKIWESDVIGEDPILRHLRRLDELPKKTGNIFKTASGNKHGIFVDILDENENVNKNNAIFLLKKIFGTEIFDIEKKKKLIDTLNEIDHSSYSLIEQKSRFNKIQVKKQLKDIINEQL